MNGNIYKLKDSIIWILLLGRSSQAVIQIEGDYSVVYTSPNLTSFSQSGPIIIDGPQKAILVFPKNILPDSVLIPIEDKANLGTYREVLSFLPLGRTTLALADLITLTEEAVVKSQEYDVKATNTEPTVVINTWSK